MALLTRSHSSWGWSNLLPAFQDLHSTTERATSLAEASHHNNQMAETASISQYVSMSNMYCIWGALGYVFVAVKGLMPPKIIQYSEPSQPKSPAIGYDGTQIRLIADVESYCLLDMMHANGAMKSFAGLVHFLAFYWSIFLCVGRRRIFKNGHNNSISDAWGTATKTLLSRKVTKGRLILVVGKFVTLGLLVLLMWEVRRVH